MSTKFDFDATKLSEALKYQIHVAIDYCHTLAKDDVLWIEVFGDVTVAGRDQVEVKEYSDSLERIDEAQQHRPRHDLIHLGVIAFEPEPAIVVCEGHQILPAVLAQLPELLPIQKERGFCITKCHHATIAEVSLVDTV